MKLHVPDVIVKSLGLKNKNDIFDHLMQLSGNVFRDMPGRKTSQIQLNQQSYFIKQHYGVGWGEIFKNWVSLKKPVVSAMTEVRAIEAVTKLGIATTPLVAYGERGRNPALIESFVITEDLGDIISLEDLCADWVKQPPSSQFKHDLIVAVANLAKTLHRNGINHRDFYLCHLCMDQAALADLDNPIKLYVIDLHRVQLHKKPSRTGNMKDIAGLYFSAMDIGLTDADIELFKQHYQDAKLETNAAFWDDVELRANKLYRKHRPAK